MDVLTIVFIFVTVFSRAAVLVLVNTHLYVGVEHGSIGAVFVESVAMCITLNESGAVMGVSEMAGTKILAFCERKI